MVIPLLATTIPPTLVEWTLTTVAGELLKGLQTHLQPNDLATIIKGAVGKALKHEPQLFSACQSDSYKGFKTFLKIYFQRKEVKSELQKTLQNQGEPSVKVLSAVLKKDLAANPNLSDHKPDYIEQWIVAFVESYFGQLKGIAFQVKRTEYLRQLSQRVDDIKFVGIAVEGEEVEKQEQLAQIFVMPTVLEEKKNILSAPVWHEEIISKGSNWRTELERQINEDAQQQLLTAQRAWAKRDQSGRKLPAQQVLSQSQNKAVLLGAPGSGKTTLVSYFALMLGEQEASDPVQIGLDPEINWLPLVVRIRDWALRPDLGLLGYLRWYAEESLAVRQLPPGFFEHWLDRGQALILLDGLDEVVNDGERRKVVEQIETFLQRYSSNPGLITSRPAGYRWDFFDLDTFPHYTLEPFDDQQITTFIDHWYSSRESDPARAERRKADLAKAFQVNDRIQLLAKNPLLLTIIALIHRYQAELPRQRYKLYEGAVKTLLRTWDSDKEIKLYEQILVYLKSDDLLYILKKLAYWIHTQGNTDDSEGGTLIDKDELDRQLSTQICDLKGCKIHEAKEESIRFIDFVKQRTGLLNEQGRDCYAFVHKTFQEYLTAEEIYDQFEDGDDDIINQHIQTYLHEQHWREVILLLVSKVKKNRAAAAIKGIVEAGSEYEELLQRDLLFAGWCLTEDSERMINADQTLIHNILDRLVNLEISNPSETGSEIRNEAATILRRLGETAFEVEAREKILAQSEHIAPLRLLEFQGSLGQTQEQLAGLLALLKDDDSDVRARAAASLGQLGNSSAAVVDGLLALLKDDDSDVRDRSVASLGQLGNSSTAVVDGLLALLKDDDLDVRARAAASLIQLGNSSTAVVDGLLALLKDDDSDVCARAAASLVQLGNSSTAVVDGLLTLLKDDASYVRYSAAASLVQLGNSSTAVVDGLFALLKDDDSDVRARSAASLVQLGNSSTVVVDGLLALLKDDDSDVRDRSVASLVQLGNSSTAVVDGLLALLKDDDSYVRARSAASLVQLGNSSTAVVDGLLALLKDDASYVRYSSAASLVQLGNSSTVVVGGLLALLKDDASDVRARSAASLVQLGNSSTVVVDGLLALLKDDASDVRARSAASLGQLGNSSTVVVDGLLALLKDDDSYVRARSAASLVQLGNSSTAVVDGLLALLKDDDSDVRDRSAASLGQLGNSSTVVVDGLLALLKDKNRRVRVRATKSLGQLEEKDPIVTSQLAKWISQQPTQSGEAINLLRRLCTK